MNPYQHEYELRDLRTVTPAEDGWRAFIVTEDGEGMAIEISFWAGIMVHVEAQQDQSAHPEIRGMANIGQNGIVDVERHYGAGTLYGYLAPGVPEPTDGDIAEFHRLVPGAYRAMRAA